VLTDAAIDNLVLGTVNAPWKRSIDADTLARAVSTGEVGDWLVHLATFFSEVRSGLVLAFANAHHITMPDLSAAYTRVKGLTGEYNAALEVDLVRMGNSA
jgi:hypothetical protein